MQDRYKDQRVGEDVQDLLRRPKTERNVVLLREDPRELAQVLMNLEVT
jgi:hypothetical protein